MIEQLSLHSVLTTCFHLEKHTAVKFGAANWAPWDAQSLGGHCACPAATVGSHRALLLSVWVNRQAALAARRSLLERSLDTSLLDLLNRNQMWVIHVYFKGWQHCRDSIHIIFYNFFPQTDPSSESAQAAITKYHWLGDSLKKKKAFISHNSGGRKSKSGAEGWGPCSRSQTLYTHMVKEGPAQLSRASSIGTPTQFMRAPSSWPNHLLKAYLLISPPCGNFNTWMRAVRNTPRSQDLSNLSLARYRKTGLKFGVFFYKYLPGQTSQSASGDSVMLKRCQMQFLAEAEQKSWIIYSVLEGRGMLTFSGSCLLNYRAIYAIGVSANLTPRFEPKYKRFHYHIIWSLRDFHIQ